MIKLNKNGEKNAMRNILENGWVANRQRKY